MTGGFVQNEDLGFGNWTVVTESRDGVQATTLSEFGYLYMSYNYGINWTAHSELGTQPWTSGA